MAQRGQLVCASWVMNAHAHVRRQRQLASGFSISKARGAQAIAERSPRYTPIW
jgi:hypothetical protein